MRTTEADTFLIDTESGVAMLAWPERQQDLDDLTRRGDPRLLLVASTTAPPICSDPLEDWVRLPVDESDLRSRLAALAQRHRTRIAPTVDEYGVLRQDDTLVFLSPYEQYIARTLIVHFGEVVPRETIERELANEFDPSRISLRVHTSRLRKRIAPLGLTISSVRNVGYVMHHAGDLAGNS